MTPPLRPPLEPPWMRPGACPGQFIRPLPPPFGYKTSLSSPRGYYGHFMSFPRPPPSFHCRPVVDNEQLWLDTFKRTHCSFTPESHVTRNEWKEPPLRLLRRQIVHTQKLVEQLKAAAMALSIVEKKMEMLPTISSEHEVHSIHDQRIKAQYERQIQVCETLKKHLEAMNATSGLFPMQQFMEIRDFASRVNKKKAYRKRAKLRRRADARIRRAKDLESRDVEARGKDEVELKIIENDESIEEKTVSSLSECVAPKQQTATCLLTNERNSSKKSLDPETLTIDAFITVRRAWDAFIAFPQTRGASTIPPHFVPPPPAPSVQWAEYVASPAHIGSGG